MMNLRLVQQDAWRVRLIHYVAKAAGLLIHIDGIPFGSSRNNRRCLPASETAEALR
jgi:hypothetical protein